MDDEYELEAIVGAVKQADSLAASTGEDVAILHDLRVVLLKNATSEPMEVVRGEPR